MRWAYGGIPGCYLLVYDTCHAVLLLHRDVQNLLAAPLTFRPFHFQGQPCSRRPWRTGESGSAPTLCMEKCASRSINSLVGWNLSISGPPGMSPSTTTSKMSLCSHFVQCHLDDPALRSAVDAHSVFGAAGDVTHAHIVDYDGLQKEGEIWEFGAFPPKMFILTGCQATFMHRGASLRVHDR